MEKIEKFKKFFFYEGIDGYIVPKNDEFFSEYTQRYNDRLNYISNFTGSYGFSLILKDVNYLFVDGSFSFLATIVSGKFFKFLSLGFGSFGASCLADDFCS